MNLPIIIKLEVENMKHTMCVALSQYTGQLDATLKQAVERFCTPENLERIIQTETDRILDEVLREEVKRWFVYGDGRAVIRLQVEQRLRKNQTSTPLDFSTCEKK